MLEIQYLSLNLTTLPRLRDIVIPSSLSPISPDVDYDTSFEIFHTRRDSPQTIELLGFHVVAVLFCGKVRTYVTFISSFRLAEHRRCTLSGNQQEFGEVGYPAALLCRKRWCQRPRQTCKRAALS